MPKIPELALEVSTLTGDEWIPVEQGSKTKKARARLFTSQGVFNPKSYGATGLGVVNDAPAIQLAIDAAQAVGGAVRFDPGVYKITSTLIVTSRVRLEGAGAKASIIVIDAENTTMLRATSTMIDLEIEGLTWRGNNTGLGGFVTGTTGGHGIALDQAQRVRIRHCAFENFGIVQDDSVHGQYADPIVGVNVIDVTVKGNYFAPSSHNRTGSDISLSGSDILVTGNKSKSRCDTHVSLGRHTNGETRHTVIANQAYRAPDAVSRSGVLVYYDGSTPAFANIQGNQLEGFYWHGVYATAMGATDAGSLIIDANTITFCGGGWGDIDAETTSWPGAGVKVQGRCITISNNTIYGTGYAGPYGAPVLRPNPSAGTGIMALNYLEHSTIIGNTIRKSSNGGIAFFVQGADPNDKIRFVECSANVVEDNAGDGIAVSPARADECVTDLSISGNTVRVPDATANGVALKPANGGWGNRIDFVDNIITHANPPGSGTVAGIQRPNHTDFTRNTGRVVGNTINGFRNGVNFIGANVVGYVPCAVQVEGNAIYGAVLGYDFGGSANWGFHLNSIGNPSTNMNNAGARPGRIIGPVTTGRPIIEFYSNQQPTSGAFIAGDVQLYFTPRGDKIGNRCVTGGSPGFWVPIHREDPFGHYARARSAFNVASLEISGIDPAAVLAVGTPTAVAWDTNRYYTRRAKLEYLDTTAATDSIGGVYTNAPEFSQVVAFGTTLIWAPATGMSVGTRRGFAGMIASASAPTDVDPSTLTQLVGMGWDDDDTQVQIIHGGAGAAVKTALGASFPKPSADRTLVYALEIHSETSGGATIIKVSELTTGVTSAEVFATGANRPSAELNPFTAWCSVGGTSGVAGAAVFSWRSWRGALATN